jgi:hypothetical protein
MRNLLRWLADRAQYKAQAIALSVENRRLAKELARVCEANLEAARHILILKAELEGMQHRLDARDRLLNLADGYIAELEAQVAVHRARRPSLRVTA